MFQWKEILYTGYTRPQCTVLGNRCLSTLFLDVDNDSAMLLRILYVLQYNCDHPREKVLQGKKRELGSINKNTYIQNYSARVCPLSRISLRKSLSWNSNTRPIILPYRSHLFHYVTFYEWTYFIRRIIFVARLIAAECNISEEEKRKTRIILSICVVPNNKQKTQKRERNEIFVSRFVQKWTKI